MTRPCQTAQMRKKRAVTKTPLTVVHQAQVVIDE